MSGPLRADTCPPRDTGSTKGLEDIELGDWVWSPNEQTGEEGFKPVVRLFRNTPDTLVHLSYRRDPGSARRGSAGCKGGDAEDGDGLSATITGTDEHPFWSLTRGGWVAMGELKPGERLLLAGGQAATTTAVRIERLAAPVTVYNFEVADWHTYHVGDARTGWVFVHNLCARGSVNKLKALRTEARTPGTELHRLANRQATQAGDGVQYALVATRSGRYPVVARGVSKPVGSINLKVGDVWKYGQTKNPGTRYSAAWLKRMNLELKPQWEGSLASRLQAEQARLDLYRIFEGRLPPGNKIRR